MSWQVMLVNAAEPPVEHLMELAEDGFDFPHFGSLDQVKEKISATLPQTQWIEPASGVLELPDSIIEFELSGEGEVTEIMLNARGTNDLEYIHQLCQAQKWSAYDCGTGAVVDIDDSQGGYSDWQGYRDFIV